MRACAFRAGRAGAFSRTIRLTRFFLLDSELCSGSAGGLLFAAGTGLRGGERGPAKSRSKIRKKGRGALTSNFFDRFGGILQGRVRFPANGGQTGRIRGGFVKSCLSVGMCGWRGVKKV